MPLAQYLLQRRRAKRAAYTSNKAYCVVHELPVVSEPVLVLVSPTTEFEPHNALRLARLERVEEDEGSRRVIAECRIEGGAVTDCGASKNENGKEGDWAPVQFHGDDAVGVARGETLNRFSHGQAGRRACVTGSVIVATPPELVQAKRLIEDGSELLCASGNPRFQSPPLAEQPSFTLIVLPVAFRDHFPVHDVPPSPEVEPAILESRHHAEVPNLTDEGVVGDAVEVVEVAARIARRDDELSSSRHRLALGKHDIEPGRRGTSREATDAESGVSDDLEWESTDEPSGAPRDMEPWDARAQGMPST